MRFNTIFKLVVITGFFIFVIWGGAVADSGPRGRANTTFSCADSEGILQAKNITSINNDGRAIYVGYQQVSTINQDPIVARFDNGVQVWCRTDYETTDDDNRATGVYWNGTDSGLYLTFSATGTQGSSSEDFRRFAQNGWLESYTDGSTGSGGGARVAIVARVNPADGEVHEATFVTAMLSSDRTNSLLVAGLTLESENILRVEALAWYSPRNPDKSRMTCSGSSPFDYTLHLTTDLSTAVSASAKDCVGNSTLPPTVVTVSPAIGFLGENRFTAVVEPEAVELPLTFTWRMNGEVVRKEIVDSKTDTLDYTWDNLTSDQTLEVIVENNKTAELNRSPISSGVKSFKVAEAQRLYLPAVIR